MDRPPVYKSISGIIPENIAAHLNVLVEENYSLRELIPEVATAGQVVGSFVYPQTYTILAVYQGD